MDFERLGRMSNDLSIGTTTPGSRPGIVLDEKLSISRDFMMSKLAEVGIETRVVFYPMHKLPIYKNSNLGISFPVAERLAANGINLPSSVTISDDDIDFVCEQVMRILEKTD